MLFSKQAPLPIVLCDVCHGSGFVNVRRCAQCRGMGMARLVRGMLLYWGETLNRYHIFLRKTRRGLRVFHMIGGIIFSLGFFVLFGSNVFTGRLGNALFTLSFWTLDGNHTAGLFWLGLASLCFVIYRIGVTHTDQEVEFHGYGSEQKMYEDSNPDVSWTQLRKISRRKRKNISIAFSDEARRILEETYLLAYRQGTPTLNSFHLFYTLLSSQKISSVFIRLGIPVRALQENVARRFTNEKQKIQTTISEDIIQILFHAYEYAYEAKQDHVETTELLVSVVRQSETIQELLYDLKVDSTKLSNVIEWLRIREKLHHQYVSARSAGVHRSKYGLDRAMTAVATPYLNSLSQDMTMAAKYGYIPPCVARDKEIEEVFRMIEGGRQSVVLVGENGVGKTTIIEGIATRMLEDDVPDRLKDKRLIQLSTSSLVAGTTVSGAQERLIRMMNEVGRAKNIILFIHNVHDLVSISAGQGQEGLDIAETLSEYLGPGRFLTLATATPDGYNRHILNTQIGSVLGRVDVKEMDVNQTIQALESKVGSLEYKHRVFYSYDSLERAAVFAGKFWHDQRLPESAIALMTEAGSAVHNHRGENQMVSGEDIAHIVSEKTGIPMTAISEDESAKLLRLEDEMHARVVGQSEAVSLVASALRRARAEIRSTSRPIANFLFLGPTGVGKTELAKTIATVYFGGEKRMIRIDMSEYQDKTSLYRLIGQPGQQGTGILTEAVRQNPFSLVLLDEMEKADPDILNLFLQVFDDARLTDSTGHLIDFSNTIIIATSNAGTQFVQDQIKQGVDLEDIRQNLIGGELKEYYRPEFLNRFDSIVLFRSLNRDEIKQIAGLMLKGVGKNLEPRGVFLRVEERALESLADVGFDPQFGARPMRRAIQERVENQIADLVLKQQLNRRDTIVLGNDVAIRIEHGTYDAS